MSNYSLNWFRLNTKIKSIQMLYRTQRHKFYPIFNKKFDHLETLLKICRPKKGLSAGSPCWPLVSSPQSKCPKRTFMLAQKYHVSISYMLSKPLKCFMESDTNINFKGQTRIRPPAKCWVECSFLPHKYHDSNFYQRF